jgi:hypothetical protein
LHIPYHFPRFEIKRECGIYSFFRLTGDIVLFIYSYFYKIGVVLMFVFLAGCASRIDKAVPWPFGTDQVVFLEIRQEEDGRVIRGDFPDGPMIDAPTYMFDPYSRSLASHKLPFNIDDTLKIVLGRSTALRGVAGAGMENRLIGIFNLPYRNEQIIVRGVDRQGTAYLLFRNQPIAVEHGEEWNEMTTRRDTINTPRGQSIAEFTRSIRIINYGLLDKSDIRQW